MVVYPTGDPDANDGVKSCAESIYKVARRIKRSENSLYNALRSIYDDSGFVGEIRALWPELPVLANLRCGLWYASEFDGACYFKSTDGHTGNWSFSSTRLNIHVAVLAAQRGGCMIVDATRKGKRFPDSMSKTIPIWACVINRAVAELRELIYSNQEHDEEDVRDLQNWDRSLHLPLWVSATEKANIEDRINDWVEKLKATGADLVPLVASLKKPLQPLWISQKSLIWVNEVPDASSWPFTPIILVSASVPTSSPVRMSDGEFSWNYISGAADDEESWARGLTPALFWEHAYHVISSGPDECKRNVIDIVEKDRVKRAGRGLEAPQIRVKSYARHQKFTEDTPFNMSDSEARRIGDGAHALLLSEEYNGLVDICRVNPPNSTALEGLHCIGATGLGISSIDTGLTKKVLESYSSAINCCASTDHGPNTLSLHVVGSKFDRHSLENNLGAAIAFSVEKLDQGNTVLVLCTDGEDISVCVCLAILLSAFRLKGGGVYERGSPRGYISKSDIKQGLRYISSFHPDARPSRGNLKQVFSHLVDQQPHLAEETVLDSRTR